MQAQTASPPTVALPKNDFSNVPKSVEAKVGRQLHNQENHPIEIVKKQIHSYFSRLNTEAQGDANDAHYKFKMFDHLPPVVSTTDNFDLLLIPPTHPSRNKTDTYYLTEQTVLRTHTSAHQNELLLSGEECFLVTGDVYRKDEIDRSHYPVFHQMEGVCLTPQGTDPKEDLLKVLNGLIEHLFPGCEYRVNDDYFPFTNPSFEYEVKFGDRWLEVLGCGVVQPKILEHTGYGERQGWAFGLGLERLAMLFFEIPDIRLFWSDSPKFLDQFSEGNIEVKFKPFSDLDPVEKDISFWIPDEDVDTGDDGKWFWAQANKFFELIRENSDDLIQEVRLLDQFFHPKKKRYSQTFRLTFCPAAEAKNPAELEALSNEKMWDIRQDVIDQLRLEVRDR